MLSGMNKYYPQKADIIADVPQNDNGGNFGRFAWTGLMDDYRAEVYREKLSGIPLFAWQRFLAMFSEERSDEEIIRSLDRMTEEALRGRTPLSAETIASFRDRLSEAIQLLQQK
mgnify:CR=1 FL=1